MKKSILIGAILLQAFFISAQNQSSQGEEIELPDVTTVVAGTVLTAGKDSIPDYSKIIPNENDSEFALPKFESKKQNEDISGTSSQDENEKSVYAEGKIGGGFPFYFTGDFSVYRTTGNSPFAINFFHENAEGFVSKDVEDGFFYRNTKIDLKKQFFREKSEYDFSAFYKNDDRGFQLKSTSFTDYLKNNFGGEAFASWKLTNDWNLSAKLNSSYYSRYGTTYPGAVSLNDDFQKSAKIFSISPEIDFGLKKSNFALNFSAKYQSQLNMKDSGTLQKAAYATSAESTHRANLGIDFAWTDENVKLFGAVSAVVGTSIGNHNFLIPFILGTQFNLKTPLSSRSAIFKIQGGIDSFLTLASILEEKNPYSVLPSLPSEQSDWYANFYASLPVKDFFDFDLNAEFRKTAFDNGFWQANYSDSTTLLASGFYRLQQTNRTDFNSEAIFKFSLEQLRFSVGWKSYWLDVPYIEEGQALKGEFFYGAKDSAWEFGASLKQFFASESDKTPVLDMNASLKASPSIRLALEATDIIKLILNRSRAFASSEYVLDSSHIKMLVKFQF
ncbi:hypothetical protein [Treponema pectinovorum]|uniref:hypothetical protein n=1 Tax=Treponema pectinovorum TaxID=164 RepID=UPI0011CA235A|nr:hypothetical protein [Treponema pectinovorum]